jgi:hypothetical protein
MPVAVAGMQDSPQQTAPQAVPKALPVLRR